MNVRLQGLIKLAVGVVLTLIVAAIGGAVSGSVAGLARVAALPLALLGFVGLIEIVAGVPFTQLQSKWDTMHGLARFGLGLLIIAAVVFLIGFVGVQMHWIG